MKLSDAIEAFLSWRSSRGIAASTMRSEGRNLRYLLADIGNLHVSNIEPRHLDVFWRNHMNWQPSTCNLARNHLSVFFQWCEVRGYRPRGSSPLEGTKARKVPQRERLIIPAHEFPTLLDGAPTMRDRILVALGLYLFTRVSETSAIRWQDLNFDDVRRGTDEWKPTVSVYRTKTQQADVLPMCEELYQELVRWRLRYGELTGEPPRPHWYVCPPYQPAEMTGVKGQRTLVRTNRQVLLPERQLSAATRQIRDVLKTLGYDMRQEGGHTLRRSGATALYHELSAVGHDRAVRVVQAMLGHSSVQTTEVYLSLDLERKARNELLAGRKMFSLNERGAVIDLGSASGQENRRAL